ncbi:hypothetical protein ScPMuIL_018833 [Solemya velum]
MPAEAPQTVVATGFGPFGIYDVNSSWVAVQELSKRPLGDDIDLHIEEISVDYKTASELVPELWKKYNPKLIVHVGVSGIASKITLEQKAHNEGYDKCDVKGCCPENHCCVLGDEGCRVSGIDMQLVCRDINEASSDVEAEVSQDAGRYLCDFTYFKSLSIDKSRAAFIHVPPLNTPYTAEQLAEGLRLAILAMLKQVS